VNLIPEAGTVFFAVEAPDGAPLAHGDKVLAFTSRERAQASLERASMLGARVVRYAGEYEVIRFMERVAAMGAATIVVDEGFAGSMSVRLTPATWDHAKVRRARARALGLELA